MQHLKDHITESVSRGGRKRFSGTITEDQLWRALVERLYLDVTDVVTVKGGRRIWNLWKFSDGEGVYIKKCMPRIGDRTQYIICCGDDKIVVMDFEKTGELYSCELHQVDGNQEYLVSKDLEEIYNYMKTKLPRL